MKSILLFFLVAFLFAGCSSQKKIKQSIAFFKQSFPGMINNKEIQLDSNQTILRTVNKVDSLHLIFIEVAKGQEVFADSLFIGDKICEPKTSAVSENRLFVGRRRDNMDSVFLERHENMQWWKIVSGNCSLPGKPNAKNVLKLKVRIGKKSLELTLKNETELEPDIAL